MPLYALSGVTILSPGGEGSKTHTTYPIDHGPDIPRIPYVFRAGLSCSAGANHTIANNVRVEPAAHYLTVGRMPGATRTRLAVASGARDSRTYGAKVNALNYREA